MLNTEYELFKGAIKNKKVAVLGLGVSNVPAIELLSSLGAVICGCDKRTQDKFDPNILSVLKHNCAELKLGDDYLDSLNDSDLIIKSPGIRVSTPEIQNAIANGKTVTSEIELFIHMCPCKIIGVTGSDGKTTTTTLIYEMLKKEGYNTHVGGNIGTPLLSRLDTIKETDMVVLELSSFQLQTLRISPSVAVVTNITPNHLDYHKDMAEYVDAKSNIFKFQKGECTLIVNADNKITNSFKDGYQHICKQFSRLSKTNGAYFENDTIFYDGEKILEASQIKIKGLHNIENYMAAICAVYPFVNKKAIVSVAETFSGVEHRMELVRDLDGVKFFNDSIGSSPTRTVAGLDAQPPGRIVLIAGGYDKNLAFDKLAEKISKRVSVLILIGATAEKIKAEVEKKMSADRKIPIMIAENMEEATKLAFSFGKGLVDAKHRASVILSPACASFDMYKNFEERGNHFKKIVNSL